MSRYKRSLFRRLYCISCCLLLGLTFGPSAAMAQGQGAGAGGGRGGQMNFGGPAERDYTSSITSTEVQKMDSRLGITDDQKPIIDASFQSFSKAYGDAAEAARSKMRDAFEQMRTNGDYSSMATTMRDLNNQWKQQSTKLETGFFDEVKSVLTKDQAGNWPLYERDYRRRKDLDRRGRGFGGFGSAGLSGENIDLYNLVDSIKPTTDELARLQPVLDMYSADLDPILIQREQATASLEDAMAAMRSQENPNTDNVKQKYDALSKIHVQLRDLNSRYAETLSTYLAPDRGQDLKQAFQKDAYSRIYRPTPVDEYVKKVEGISSITPDQKAMLASVQTDFNNRVGEINRQLSDLDRKGEVERQSQMFQQFLSYSQRRQQGGGGRGGDFGGPPGRGQQNNANDPMTKLEQQKRDLVETTLTSIFSTLTPEQQQAAPKPSAESGRGFRGGFGDRERGGRNGSGGDGN